jgi:hypothetical protein
VSFKMSLDLIPANGIGVEVGVVISLPPMLLW